MVYQVSSAVNIPVVGMGGVSSAEDVIEMMLAGATAVEIGAANLVDPFICKKIVEALPAAADKYNINELKDIIGGAIQWVKMRIIACDFADKETALNFSRQIRGQKAVRQDRHGAVLCRGPQIVREIKARGHKIFLDLKLHDIPNTVKKSMAVLSRLDVDMCNLHAAGTSRMMEAALEGLTRPDGTRPPAHRRDPADLHRSGRRWSAIF